MTLRSERAQAPSAVRGSDAEPRANRKRTQPSSGSLLDQDPLREREEAAMLRVVAQRQR